MVTSRIASAAQPEIIRIHGQDVPIERRHVADLVVTGGRVIIANVLMPSVAPLIVGVPPGRYPVILSRVVVPDVEERNAFVTLEISDKPPVAWTWAEPERPDATVRPPRSQPDGRPAFSVDSWHAAFMDVDARVALDEKFGQTHNILMQEHQANNGT